MLLRVFSSQQCTLQIWSSKFLILTELQVMWSNENTALLWIYNAVFWVFFNLLIKKNLFNRYKGIFKSENSEKYLKWYSNNFGAFPRNLKSIYYTPLIFQHRRIIYIVFSIQSFQNNTNDLLFITGQIITSMLNKIYYLKNLYRHNSY